MKKLAFLFIFMGILWGQYSQAQVCISGTCDNPDASAMLDVKSSSLGLLPPRVADTNAISSPAEALQIYDLSSHCMRYYNGSKWSDCMDDCSGSSGGGSNPPANSSDLDGDGVPNEIDLDDDNDGIPDKDEATCVASGTRFSKYEGLANNTPLDGTTAPTNITGVDIYHHASHPDVSNVVFKTQSWKAYMQNYYGTAHQDVVNYYSYVFNQSSDHVKLYLDDLDVKGSSYHEYYIVLGYGDGSQVTKTVELAPHTQINEDGGYEAHDGTNRGPVKVTFNSPIDSIVIEQYCDWKAGIYVWFPEGCATSDTDNDGVVDAEDLDSDNDGIYDIDEAGNGANDTDNDGRTDLAVGNNGLDNSLEDKDTQAASINYTILDSDSDGSPNQQETDADNDGCTDANEAYASGTADGGDGGQYGPDPATVDANGVVTSAAYDYTDANLANTRDASVHPACPTPQ